MASAVLASQNEPCWGERKVYMRKYTNTTTAASATAAAGNTVNNNHIGNPLNPTLNANLNKQIRNHDPPSNVHFKETPPMPLSADVASPKRKSAGVNKGKETSRAGHVTFNLGAYTSRELKELKKRLLSELEQVRILRARMENTNFEARSSCPTSHQPPPPPSPPLPPPPVEVIHAADPPKGKKKGPGSRRANPCGNSGHRPKQKRPATDPSTENVAAGMRRKCGQILTKLMKHKHGWVFNVPVDVVALGLHDYRDIIKRPMDLGTVKSNLEKKLYSSPLDFASDVRLTFNNALRYNPKGHDVYFMAETLLANFEEMFKSVFQKFEKMSQQEKMMNQNVSSVPVSEPMSIAEPAGLMAKLPKPKARETNKREMSFEEKTMLGRSLVELPQEKMVQLLSIVKKRNGDIAQDGDEIELDIEVLDNETLWELDRFVSNYKKTVSKSRRQALMNAHTQAPVPAATAAAEMENECGFTESEMVEAEAEPVQRSKKLEVVEEDVDIGEEIPVENYPPVEIERDGSSSSSGSSGDSSSSSGSDSGSSSGTESDDDSVQSPFVEAKDAHGT